MSDIPRRSDINRNTKEELIIRDAIRAIELLGADRLLTQAQSLLADAKERLSDWVDRELQKSGSEP